MNDAPDPDIKHQTSGTQTGKRGNAARSIPNRHDFRESWLRSAVDELRPYFASIELPLPRDIRVAIGFPSTGRKGKRLGECWHSESSDDGFYEIFIRADLSKPVEILAVLIKELVHAALPSGVQHGKLFKGAAIKVGLQGKMREAHPGLLLQQRLAEIAETLGPLPHASLHIQETPLIAVAPPPVVALDLPKKQRSRLHKAECQAEGCNYVVRVAAKQVREIGAPHCPKHGAMTVTLPPEDRDDEPAAPDAETRLNASDEAAASPA